MTSVELRPTAAATAVVPPVPTPSPHSQRPRPASHKTRAPKAPVPQGTWSWQNPKPTGDPLFGLSCPSAAVCFAVGYNWPILATVNGGTTWTPQTSAVFMNAISCATTTSCVAVGDFGIAMWTADGGATWHADSTANGNYLLGVSCPTATLCFASGYAGEMWRSADGGADWTGWGTNTTNDLWSVDCADQLFCVAVGDNGTITRTTNGLVWSTIFFGNGVSLYGVSCPTNQLCTTVGSGFSPFTYDGGNTWNNASSPVLFGVSCQSLTQCMAAGADGSVYVEESCPPFPNYHIGCWTRASTSETGALNAISCQSATLCFAAGDYGIIVNTGNGGTGWAKQSPNVIIPSLSGISCASTSVCVAVGPGGAIVGTTDGGVTWPKQTSGTPNPIYSVSCPSTTVCFAPLVGGVLATTTGGASWSNQPTGVLFFMHGVSCASISFCVAVGDSGQLIRTTDGGATWPAALSGTSADLKGVSCPSTTVCFAVSAGAVIGTTNGGTIWSEQTTITGQSFAAISCPSTTVCFAVGVSAIYATTDGGAHWNDQTPAGTWAFSSVSCPSPTVCFAVGGSTSSGSGGGSTVFDTADGGAHWNQQSSTIAASLTGVSCPSTTTCFAVSLASGQSSSSIFATTDGGATPWQVITPSGTQDNLFKVSCASATTCFAITGNTVMTTTNGGTGWFPSFVLGNTTFNSIDCPSTSSCYAVAGTNRGLGESTIYGTTDGGAIWNALVPASTGSGPDPGYRQVSCPTTTTCFAVAMDGTFVKTTNGTDWSAPQAITGAAGALAISCPSASVCFVTDGFSPAKIYKTPDGGATWALTFDTATDPYVGGSGSDGLWAIDCPSTTACYSVGSSGLIATTSDGGANWRGDFPPTGTGLFGLSCPSASTCFAAGDDSVVLRTTDFGRSWEVQDPAQFSHLRDISCVSLTACFTVGLYGAISATSTGGAAWSTSRPSESTADIEGISCYGPSNCYAAAVDTLFATDNGGTTWTSTKLTTTDQVLGISCPAANTCFAVGWPGAIYVTTNGGTDWNYLSNPLSGSDETLWSVSCATVTDCVTVGLGGKVLSTTDGHTWNVEASGTTSHLFSVSCPSVYTCIAVGAGGREVTRSGGSWAIHPSGTIQHLIGVNCPTTSTCYTVGTGGTIRVTTNQGLTWAARTSGTTATLYGIACIKPSYCVADGSFGTVLVTVDGATWKLRPAPTLNSLQATAFPDLDHSWLVGLGGTILANPALIPSCTSVSITPDVSSPGAVGAIVTLTGAASGCPDPSPSYRFYLRNPAGVWSIVRSFSINPSFTWNTASYAPGTYLIGVWAKDSQSGFTYDAYAFGTFTLQRMPCTAVEVHSDLPSPATSGMLVTFTIPAPSGCPQPLEQWWVRNPAGGWSIVSPYQLANSVYAWHTDGLPDGTYQVGVWAKQRGSTKSYEAYGFVTYTLYSGPIDAACHFVDVSADNSPPMVIGPTLNLTAFANCDTTQYKWWVRDPAGHWTVVKDYSSTATYAWATNTRTAGTYQLGVWVRQGGSTASYQAYSFITFTLINAPTYFVCNFVNVLPGMASPEPPGTSIYFTAVSGGCTLPNFQFWVLPPGGTWTIVQPYGPTDQYVWDTTGLSPGPWQIGVWLRQAGSTASYQAFAFITFQLTFG